MPLTHPIDDRTIARLKAVDLKTARTADLLGTLDQETLEAIHRQARISTIGASTRIENAVLTDAQIDWMDTVLATDGRPTAFAAMRPRIEAKLSTDRERSLEEVAGCREMMAIVYSQATDLFPLTHAALGGLHQVLLGHHPAAAHHRGRYKIAPNRLSSVISRPEGSAACCAPAIRGP